MQVRLRSLTGTTDNLKVPNKLITVHELKSRIQAQLRIPCEMQRLIFQGKELVNMDFPLESYKVIDNSVIHVVVRETLPADAIALPDVEAMQSALRNSEYQRSRNGGNNSDGHIYEVFRLSRIIMKLALIDTFSLMISSIYLYPVFIFIIFPLSAYYGVQHHRHSYLIPYVLYLIGVISVRFYVIGSAIYWITSVISLLVILFELYILRLIVKFVKSVKALSEEETNQMSALIMIQ